MGAYKANNFSGSNDFELHRAKRRSAWESFFDESDSDDEGEILHPAYPITNSFMKAPIREFRCNKKECHVITNLQKDQLLNVCCAHCECCKKIKEFLEGLATNKSAESYDNGLRRTSRNRIKRFKKTLSTPKPSMKGYSLDKHCDLNLPNYPDNNTGKTTDRSTAKIGENEVPLSDLSTDTDTSEQNCTAINAELNKTNVTTTNDENSNTIEILPNVQNHAVSSKKLKTKRKGTKKEIETKKNGLIGRNGTEPNNTVNSSKDHLNDVPEKTGNNISSNSETDPFNLKCEKRTTRSNRNNRLVEPLLKVPVDTTVNRSFSKAAVRKLGRTGGISFDMEFRKTANGPCKSFHTHKSRTLYSSDEWLNSEGFLKLSGDEY